MLPSYTNAIVIDIVVACPKSKILKSKFKRISRTATSYSKFVEKNGIVFIRIFHPYYITEFSTHKQTGNDEAVLDFLLTYGADTTL